MKKNNTVKMILQFPDQSIFDRDRMISSLFEFLPRDNFYEFLFRNANRERFSINSSVVYAWPSRDTFLFLVLANGERDLSVP